MLARPRISLALVLLLTLALLPAAMRVRVDAAVDRLLPRGDAASTYLEAVRATFGSDEIALVALFADDVFAPETLARIARLTETLGTLDGVSHVASLSNLEHIRIGPDGLGRERVLPPSPWTPDVLGRVRADALRHPMARTGIVAADGRAAGIVLRLLPMTDDELIARNLPARIRAAVAADPGPEAVAVTGVPIIKVAAAEAMITDITRFFAAGVLIVAAVLFACFRTAHGVGLPLGAVLVGLVWSSATMTLLGGAYSLGTLVLPPLLLSIGIAYAIHFVSRWDTIRTTTPSPVDAARRTLHEVGLPVAMAGLTTLVGFGAFVRSPIPSIRDFGCYAGIGVTCILLATWTILPCAFVLLGPHAAAPTPRAGRWIDRATNGCVALAFGRRRTVLLVAIAMTLIAAVGIGGVTVETDYLRFFDRTHPARADAARVAEALVGTQLVVVSLEGDRPEALTSLAVADGIAKLSAFLAAQPGVDAVTSYLDTLRLLRQGIEPDDATSALPDQAALDQRLMLIDPESTRTVLSADRSRGRLLVYTHLSGSRRVRDLVDRIARHAHDHLPTSIVVRATGTLVLLTESADALARQQVAGLGQVLVVLAVAMIFLFRSLRLGLLSLVPNVFPVIVLFGLMGWLAIDLDISTSMIACIAIGIAVDDTIHYVTTWERSRRRVRDPIVAATATVGAVGRPIVVTSIVLTAGFLVPCLSTFRPVRHFGILASATMAVALFADLLLLPALLASQAPTEETRTR